MTSRHRFEAAWTHPDASVRGKVRRDRAWVIALLFALVVGLATVTWSRMMGVADVTYELRVCEQPLTATSSWAEVQAAGCDVSPTAGSALTLWAAADQQEPDVTAATSWTFQDVPVNTSATGVQLDLEARARSVVLAEPTNEQVRRALTGDAGGRRWTANVGARGPVSYWVLVTPSQPG